jgi:hypothetical protein
MSRNRIFTKKKQTPLRGRLLFPSLEKNITRRFLAKIKTKRLRVC